MDMIRGDRIVQNLEPESFFGFKKPFDPVVPIPCKFEQEFLFVAPVSDVPDMVGKKISVRSWHDGSQKNKNNISANASGFVPVPRFYFCDTAEIS